MGGFKLEGHTVKVQNIGLNNIYSAEQLKSTVIPSVFSTYITKSLEGTADTKAKNYIENFSSSHALNMLALHPYSELVLADELHTNMQSLNSVFSASMIAYSTGNQIKFTENTTTNETTASFSLNLGGIPYTVEFVYNTTTKILASLKNSFTTPQIGQQIFTAYFAF